MVVVAYIIGFFELYPWMAFVLFFLGLLGFTALSEGRSWVARLMQVVTVALILCLPGYFAAIVADKATNETYIGKLIAEHGQPAHVEVGERLRVTQTKRLRTSSYYNITVVYPDGTTEQVDDIDLLGVPRTNLDWYVPMNRSTSDSKKARLSIRYLPHLKGAWAVTGLT